MSGEVFVWYVELRIEWHRVREVITITRIYTGHHARVTWAFTCWAFELHDFGNGHHIAEEDDQESM